MSNVHVFNGTHQNGKGAEADFASETRRRILRGISSPKSERVKRTWIPTTSLVNSCNALPSPASMRSP
jgi:hypothetical protein